MSTAPSLPDILRKSGLLPTLTREDFALLAPVFESRSFAPNEVLFKEGESGDYLVIVVQGTLEVRVDKFDRGIRTTKTIAKVNMFGVVGDMSCMDPSPRSATVVAQNEVDVLVLSRGIIDRLKAESPVLFTKVVHGLSNRVASRLRETEAKIALGLRSAPDMQGDKSSMFGKLVSAFSSTSSPQKAQDVAQDRSLPQVVIPKKTPPPREATRGLKLPRENMLTLFNTQEILELEGMGKSWIFPEGALLAQEGTTADSCFLLTAGDLEVIKNVGASGERTHVISSAPVGSMVGQLGLVDGGPRNATLRAHSTVSAIAVDREVFKKLFTDSSSLALHFQELVITATIRQLRMAMWADAGRWTPGWG